jgi:heme A synthase
MLTNPKRFTQYAWFLVAYNLLVILWGGLVRATGSGAGCGNHWPVCNGQITHLPQTLEAFIEIFHRWTSTLDGLLVILLVVFAFRAFDKTHTCVRALALVSLAFIIIEGLLGAALVRFDWVVDNASRGRAIAVALHLVNTLFLLAALSATAWFSRLKGQARRRENEDRAGLLLGIALVSTVIFAAMGAVTALGDTLFPAATLAAGFAADLDPASSFLIRLRVIHPALAVGTAVYLFWVLGYLGARDLGAGVKTWAKRLGYATAAQIAAGFATLLLLAPLPLQMIHLLFADLFWLALWLTSLNAWFVGEGN